MVDKVGTRAILILNRVIRGTLLGAEIAQEIAAMGHPVAATELGSRVAYAASMGDGRTVMETQPSSHATAEMYNLAKEVLAHAGRTAERKDNVVVQVPELALAAVAAAGGRRR
jgi:chromosome partitioning protein